MSNPSLNKVSRDFIRLGWIGFWVQAVLAIIPLLTLSYFALGQATGATVGLGFVDYLALLGLSILAFTTAWSYRYTRIGRRIVDPDRRPPQSSITRTLWIGLWAGSIGIVVSVILLLIEVIRLLILFLKAPQGGVPVIQTQVDNRAAWVSAIDVVSLLAELCTLVGELVVVGFSLWLLYRITAWGSGKASDDKGPDATPSIP